MEVMAATAILSLGIVLIYEAFFTSLDSFNYCSNHLNIMSWADEKIWQAQDKLSRFGPLTIMENEGGFTNNKNKNFTWNLSYALIDIDLYRIDLAIYWQEGRRKIKVSRSVYAIYEGEE